MKKSNHKRLVLRAITVANLDAEQLGQVAGGLPPYTKHSVCMEQCCATDPNVNCPRTF